MSTHPNHNQPLGILNPNRILLWVPQRRHVNTIRQLDVVLCPPSDEHGLSTPFHGDGGPRLDAGEVDFEGGEGENVFTGGHAEDEFEDEKANEGGVYESATCQDEVRERAFAGVARWVALVVV